MSETIITVRGHHEAWFPAERATVRLTIGFEGSRREPVFQRATDAAAAVTAGIRALHDPQAGPVTWWSADSIRVWSHRPWNQDGKQLPPVFHSALAATAKFRDFDALARWIEQTAELGGVTIDGVGWALTEAKRTAVTAEVRSRAVRDASDKARVFAQSIGLGEITPIALADPGMLGDPGGPGASGGAGDGSMSRMMKAGGGAGGTLAFAPEDISISASVDARFVAR
ncbi:SIMPL domain-containing protein [Homoserinibacter sp. YIM 151385]|uniref:SIMPL domain-containing protein n=1 Tax=Homoserinibacter sp. YIM 151385 TaxID=2985506 RepID=UPI0022EFF517|nr:SIMPL domain-containing protein [Homoserinibacter sp. YIM 151385]WBU38213.1 SIMPL domain-containing protein [Homoserinibacter sp. YIM 151385]